MRWETGAGEGMNRVWSLRGPIELTRGERIYWGVMAPIMGVTVRRGKPMARKANLMART